MLVSVAGLTPQVITETLYCLMRVRKPPADVSEIWVITTEPGKRKVERTLLDPRHGRFFAFCRDHRLGADRLRFGPENVVAIPGQDGRSLEDIRTAEDSAAAADFILDFIRKLASDSSHVLHCSVAGGRKTMGFYLGLALQLYGRATDTLSHVLVSPSELEGDPAFYYPPPRQEWVMVKGKRVRARDIKLELAEMPVLMLRGKLPALEEPGRSYTDLVKGGQEDYALLNAPPRAYIDRGAFSLTVAGRRVRLSPLETAMYLLFARARRDGCGQAGCPGCRRCTFAASDFLGEDGVGQLRSAIRALVSEDSRLEDLRGWETDDPTDPEKRFREVRSRLNRKIERGLGAKPGPSSTRSQGSGWPGRTGCGTAFAWTLGCSLSADSKVAGNVAFLPPPVEGWQRRLDGRRSMDSTRVRIYDIQLVTPAFVAGADQQTPEIRAPSIRGCLRWWFRLAQRGSGASLGDIDRAEEAMFGSTERGQRLILRVRGATSSREAGLDYRGFGLHHQYLWFPVRPAKESREPSTRPALAAKTTFRLEAMVPAAVADAAGVLAQLDQIVTRWVLFGGIGMRGRRCAGSLWFASRLPSGAPIPAGAERVQQLLEDARGEALKRILELKLSPQTFPDWRRAVEDVGNRYRGQRKAVKDKGSLGRKALPALGWPIMNFRGARGERLVVEGEERDDRGERMASPVMLKVIPDGQEFRWLLAVIKEPFVDRLRSGEGEVGVRDVVGDFASGFESASAPPATRGGPRRPGRG